MFTFAASLRSLTGGNDKNTVETPLSKYEVTIGHAQGKNIIPLCCLYEDMNNEGE
jgi:hypothetical protein